MQNAEISSKKLLSLSQNEILCFADKIVSPNVMNLKKCLYCLVFEAVKQVPFEPIRHSSVLKKVQKAVMNLFRFYSLLKVRSDRFQKTSTMCLPKKRLRLRSYYIINRLIVIRISENFSFDDALSNNSCLSNKFCSKILIQFDTKSCQLPFLFSQLNRSQISAFPISSPR